MTCESRIVCADSEYAGMSARLPLPVMRQLGYPVARIGREEAPLAVLWFGHTAGPS